MCENSVQDTILNCIKEKNCLGEFGKAKININQENKTITGNTGRSTFEINLGINAITLSGLPSDPLFKKVLDIFYKELDRLPVATPNYGVKKYAKFSWII